MSTDYLLGRTDFPRYEDRRAKAARGSYTVSFADFVEFMTPRQLRLMTYYNALTEFRQGALLERAKVLYEEQESEGVLNQHQSKNQNKKR